MGILNVIYKIRPYIQTATGYIKFKFCADDILANDGKDLQNKLDIIENKIDNVCDYIVEEGYNENGNYRKWNSGILEQWQHRSKTTWKINNAYGTLYQGTYNWIYPIPFIEKPEYVTCPKALYGTSASWANVYHHYKDHATLRAWDAFLRDGDYQMEFFAYARGRWK